jgi:hypothetical protein
MVFKFMDLFDTALQVQGPTVHLTLSRYTHLVVYINKCI